MALSVSAKNEGMPLGRYAFTLPLRAGFAFACFAVAGGVGKFRLNDFIFTTTILTSLVYSIFAANLGKLLELAKK